MKYTAKITRPKKLDFLVGGANAGPKKIEQAELQGVQLLTAAQFRILAVTGELPIFEAEVSAT